MQPGPFQRPGGPGYFPWQACCFQCNRWFTSYRGTDQHPILGAEQSKSKVWTSQLITNYRLDSEGWSLPGGWAPQASNQSKKEEPRPLPPLINLSQRRRWTQSVESAPAYSARPPISQEFLIQVRSRPSLVSSPSLHPIAKSVMEPPCLPTLFFTLTRWLHTFLSPKGSTANRVCCLPRIPKALRYKGAVIEWLGRTLLKEIFVSISTHHQGCWSAGCNVFSVRRRIMDYLCAADGSQHSLILHFLCHVPFIAVNLLFLIYGFILYFFTFT